METSISQNLSNPYNGELDLCTTDEHLKVSYQCSLDLSVKIDPTALQATFDKALLDHIASQSAASSSRLDGEELDAIPAPPARQAPRTSAGVEIPLEVISSILGHLKADHQIRSLTSFQQCSRYTYVVARPIIYTDLVVSLHGLGKIQTMVYLPSCMSDFEGPVSARSPYLSAVDINPERMDSQEESSLPIEHAAVTTSSAYTTMRSAKVEDRLVVDATEGSLAIQDLEEGTGSRWFGLKAADRLRYNARGVVRMLLVPSKSVEPKYLWSRKKLYALNAWGRVGTEIEDEAWRNGSEQLRLIQRPFQRLDELRIENLCLLQLRQEWDVIAAMGLEMEIDNHPLFGSLRALSCTRRLSAIYVDLSYPLDLPLSDYFTHNLWNVFHRLADYRCLRIGLTGPAQTIQKAIVQIMSDPANLSSLTIDLSAENAETWPPPTHMRLFFELLLRIEPGGRQKPRKITWVVRCPWSDQNANLQSLHQQRHTAATSPGSRKLQIYARHLSELVECSLKHGFD